MNVLSAVLLNPVTTTLKICLSTHLKIFLEELVKGTSLKTPVCQIPLNGLLANLMRIWKPTIRGKWKHGWNPFLAYISSRTDYYLAQAIGRDLAQAISPTEIKEISPIISALDSHMNLIVSLTKF